MHRPATPPLHTIRLREPWNRESPSSGDPAAVRFRRAFHRPTGLDGDERVWLAIDDTPGLAAATLNGSPLPLPPPEEATVRCDITPLLQPRNELTIVVRCPAGSEPVAMLGPVRLEIG